MKLKKHYFTRALLITSAISLSSCGMLGSKNKPAENSKVGGTGCLDNSKDLVGRYVKGEMSREEWQSSFACINQSLDFFTQYVRGSNENAYSQGDMYTLISRFLITNRPVHRELMRGAFNLKQALFGGDASEFTKDQIDLLKNALLRLEQITEDLIPYLKVAQDPRASFQDLDEMVVAFKRAGDQIADYMTTLPVSDMSDQALTVLIEQLADTLDFPIIDGLDRKVFLAKWMMFNTRRDAIEGQDWPQFFRAAMTFGGITLSFKSSATISNPNNESEIDRLANDYRYREYLWSLAQHVKPIIIDSLTKHEGNTPFPLFDHVIDELPDNFLNGMPKSQLKMTMREFVRKFLLSQTQVGVDQNVVDTLYSLVGNLIQDLGSLDRFYEASNANIYDTPADVLTTKLNQYGGGLVGAEKTRFEAVKSVMLSYPPLFHRFDNDDGTHSYAILYQPGVGYTRLQNLYTVAADRVLKHLLRTYGSGADFFVDTDFQTLFTAEVYGNFLFAINFLDLTVPGFGVKRFRDIDLFTPVSDGNQRVTSSEIIHYGMEVISAATLTNKMRKEIAGENGSGGPCDQNLGLDNLGWTWIPAPCFRNQFNKRLEDWIGTFPRLKAYWATLDQDGKDKALIWLEHGSRRNGYEGASGKGDEPFAKFDFGAMAAILHYTETLFTRFDVNNSEQLSKLEIMNAYPVFKSLIAKQAAMDDGKTYVLKGIFSYIVKYKDMPITNSASGLAKLGWWLATYSLPTTKVSTDRSGIFNIVCQLAAPEYTATWTKTEKENLNRRICSQ